MTAPVYLLREPASSLPYALFHSDDRRWTVVAIEEAVMNKSSAEIAEVISPGAAVDVREKQLFTYSGLLEVLLKAGKVITL